MKATYIVKIENYTASDGCEVAFLTPKDGVQFIHAGVESIRLRELMAVPLVLLTFNGKLFCVTERTSILDMIDEHDAKFDGEPEKTRCLESMTQ